MGEEEYCDGVGYQVVQGQKMVWVVEELDEQ